MNATRDVSGPIVIAGSRGRLGTALAAHYAAAGSPLWTCTRQGGASHRLDLTAATDTWQLPERPALAFLCAAVTGLDACANDPEGSRRVNVDASCELARQLAGRGAFVVFLSTSAVFDGQTPLPGPETPPSPSSEYGRQKAAAERAIALLGERVAIVRPTKVLSADLPLIAGWAERLARGDSVSAYADLPLAPVTEDFIAAGLARIGAAARPGIWHLSASSDVSYADVCRTIAAAMELPPARVRATRGEVRPGLFGEKPPAHAALDMSRTSAELGIPAPAPDAALAALAALFRRPFLDARP